MNNGIQSERVSTNSAFQGFEGIFDEISKRCTSGQQTKAMCLYMAEEFDVKDRENPPKTEGQVCRHPLKLKHIVKEIEVEIRGEKEVVIHGICNDSRSVKPGQLFIAKKGKTYDGTEFIRDAVLAGAVAIVTDLFDPFLKITQIIHPKPDEIEPKIAAAFFSHPAKKLFMVGITGTKGKTSTAYLTKYLLDHLGQSCGLIGTVETIIGDKRFPVQLTTQDVLTNHRLLGEMVASGQKAAVMEVSSHGLVQGRVAEISFDIGLFTNLYEDHLDYHKTVEEYVAAKKMLFSKASAAIVNADSFWGSYPGFSFGIEKGDLRAKNIVYTEKNIQFVIDSCPFVCPLIGKCNVYNVLGAIAVGYQRGASLSAMSAILATFPGIPGRLERIGNVFVDFAHTGEALESVLATLKEISLGRVIVVFGCGGNRDPNRRVKMGQAADNGADIAIVTSDNPRQEDPKVIAEQICSAFSKRPLVELDRKQAITLALSLASPQDLILIAGKGHEKTQIFAHQTIPFDDVLVVKELLQILKKDGRLE